GRGALHRLRPIGVAPSLLGGGAGRRGGGEELLAAGFGGGRLRARLGDLPRGLVALRAQRAFVDDEEGIARRDALAADDGDLGERAGDRRCEVERLALD